MNKLQGWRTRLGLALGGRSNLAGLLFSQYEEEGGVQQPDPDGKYLTCYREAIWVYACVDTIASFGASVPVGGYQIPRGGLEADAERLPYDHDLEILLREPNPVMSGREFCEAIHAYKELHGNAYILKDDGRPEYQGPPTALWIMRPDRVKIIPNTLGIPVAYEYGVAGKVRPFPANQVIHSKYFNPYDPLYGQGTIAALRQTILLDLNAQILNNARLANGGRMDGYFKFPGASDPKIRAQFRAEVMKIHGGPKKSGKFGILWGDAAWQDMGIAMADMQYIEARKMNREEIMAAMHCYPAVMSLSSVNYATANAEFRMFADYTMAPKVAKIAEALTAKLAPEFGDGIIVKHDWTNVPALREDMVAMAQAASQVVTAGILSRNDARKKFFHEPAFVGGQTIYQPAMLVPVGDVEETTRQAKAPGAGKREAEPKVLTPYQERRLVAYARTVKALESSGEKLFRAMFDKQEALAVTNLNRSRGQRGLVDVYDEEEFAKLSEAAVKKILYAAAAEGILHGKDPLDFMEISFDLNNPKLAQWIKDFGAKHVKWIEETTRTELQTAISEAVNQGKTLKEIESVIRESFDLRRNNAATIARTEVQAGVQNTQSMLWKESGVVKEKEWLPSGHPETRHDNMTWIVGLDEQFTNLTTGAKMMTPGDSNANEPGETINCLCDMAPVVSVEAKGAYLLRKLARETYPATGKGSRLCQTKENLSKIS